MGNSNSASISFAEGMSAVRAGVVPHTDAQTWKLVFDSDATPVEIASVMTAEEVRRLRCFTPANLAMLIYKCIRVLRHFTNVKDNELPPSGDIPVARTALLVLARVIPFALEPMPKDPASLMRPENADTPVHPHSADFGRLLFEEGFRFDRENTCFEQLFEGKSLGDTLVDVVIGCGVTAGFAVGTRQVKHIPAGAPFENVDAGRLWGPGIIYKPEAPLHTDAETMRNRLCVMRCLIALASEQAYSSQVLVRSKLRDRLVDVNTPNAQTLAASLFATVSSYAPMGSAPYTSHWVSDVEDSVCRSAQVLVLLLDATPFHPPEVCRKTNVHTTDEEKASDKPAEAPKGGATADAKSEADKEVADAAASVARASHPDADTDERGDSPAFDEEADEEDHSGQGVDGGDEAAAEDGDAKPAPAPAAAAPEAPFTVDTSKHAYWSIARNLAPREAQNFVSGLCNLLDNSVASRNTYLPSSQRGMPGMIFYFSVFWLLMERAPPIVTAFVTSEMNIRRSVIALLDFGNQGVTMASRSSQIQLAASALATLSTSRPFVLGLNQVLTEWIPYDVQGFTGTFADLIFITLHGWCLKREPPVVSHRPLYLSVMSNIAPYVTTLSSVTSTKLVGLLLHMSSPSYLTANPMNPRQLPKLVNAIASLVQYQSAGSRSLIYALVRQRAAVKALVDCAHNWDKCGLPKDYYRDPCVFTLHCTAQAADEELANMLKTQPTADPLELLKVITLVGKIPVPHPLRVLTFAPTPASDGWRASWFWSLIYAHFYPHIIDPESVAIFKVQQRVADPAALAQQQQQQQQGAQGEATSAPQS